MPIIALAVFCTRVDDEYRIKFALAKSSFQNIQKDTYKHVAMADTTSFERYPTLKGKHLHLVDILGVTWEHTCSACARAASLEGSSLFSTLVFSDPSKDLTNYISRHQ